MNAEKKRKSKESLKTNLFKKMRTSRVREQKKRKRLGFETKTEKTKKLPGVQDQKKIFWVQDPKKDQKNETPWVRDRKKKERKKVFEFKTKRKKEKFWVRDRKLR